MSVKQCPECWGWKVLRPLAGPDVTCPACLGTGSVWGEARPAYGTESLALFALPDPLGTLDMFDL
jgi:hypothetical protein